MKQLKKKKLDRKKIVEEQLEDVHGGARPYLAGAALAMAAVRK